MIPLTEPLYHKDKTMKALVYHGSNHVSVETHPLPRVTDPRDVVVKMEATTVCGSDLHLFHGSIPETEKGDIFGHEGLGTIVEKGPEVQNFEIGDRVVISAVIACGECKFCQMKRFSNCDSTNNSKTMDALYGGKTAGLFGYSHLTGGYPGLQAEFARIPVADVNLLKIDDLDAKKALLLSDVGCTAYQAALYADLDQPYHDSVVVWGAGPIGSCAAYYAKKLFQCPTVLALDPSQQRLDVLKQFGILTLNVSGLSSKVTKEKIMQVLDGQRPDSVIDATGFRYAKTWTQGIQKAVGLETDAIDCLKEAIEIVRKSGTVSIIGDYIGLCNQFPIGAVMEKGLVIKSGQLHCQAYWGMLFEKLKTGEIDLSWVYEPKEFKFEEIADLYEHFDHKAIMKPFIRIC